MNILELSKKAQDFYESTRTKTLYSGYEKNVLVREDYSNCLFVDSKYKVQPGDVIFRCRTINQNTVIDLKVQIPEAPSISEIALKSKFKKEEWALLLDKMNGILHTIEIDARDEIAGEVEDVNSDLATKVKSLNKVEGEILLREIQRFWNNEFDFNKFVEQYL